MNIVEYVHIDVSGIEDTELRAIVEQSNATAKLVAETHGMVADIYKIFEQLKPLIGAMPMLPKGMVPPPMPPFPIKR